MYSRVEKRNQIPLVFQITLEKETIIAVCLHAAILIFHKPALVLHFAQLTWLDFDIN